MTAIVTDSSAYLTRAEAQALGVLMAPMTLNVGDCATRPEGFIGENGDCEALIGACPERTRTSQVTRADFIDLFSEIAARGDEALCLTMSSRLSGTYANAVMAAREVAPDSVTVVDSRVTCAGLYLLLRRARRLIDEGLSPRETADRIERLRGDVRIVFTVDDIGPLRRSGRLGGVRLSISTILNIRPVLGCVDGSITAIGTARGRAEQFRTLMAGLPDAPGECVVEDYAAAERAAELAEQIRAAGHNVTIRQIGPVLGLHLGKGCVGVSFIR